MVNFEVACSNSLRDIKQNHFVTAAAEADIEGKPIRLSLKNTQITCLSQFTRYLVGIRNISRSLKGVYKPISLLCGVGAMLVRRSSTHCQILASIRNICMRRMQ